MFVVRDVHRNRTKAQFVEPQENEVRNGNDRPMGFLVGVPDDTANAPQGSPAGLPGRLSGER